MRMEIVAQTRECKCERERRMKKRGKEKAQTSSAADGEEKIE